MGKPLLTENFIAGAAINPHRICKPGAADGTAIQAAAVGDFAFGVSDELGAASGGRCDIHTAGVADVEFGGNVTRGAQLTSDADGKAVTAVATNRTIGVARVSGVLGDIGSVLLAPGTV
jgi:hypothetical protein